MRPEPLETSKKLAGPQPESFAGSPLGKCLDGWFRQFERHLNGIMFSRMIRNTYL